MLRSTADNNKINNAGFSLVELIVVVAILAIAAIPLMKSMGMASKTNATAQSIQNATSLAEHVMEEVKSSDIEALAAAHGGFSSGECTYDSPLTSVTQGEEFVATITISKNTYATPVPESSTEKSDRVAAANVLKLPRIEEIDTLSQAVLSSTKEFNRYDDAAQSYFNERKADYNPLNLSDPKAATIDSKTIDIVKSNFIIDGHSAVRVTATVTYVSGGNQFVRELYTGSFVQATSTGIDSNIYIFYKKGSMADTINITDTSAYNPGGAAKPEMSHKVYFIRQDPDDYTGPSISINGASAFKYVNLTPTPEPTGTPDEGEFHNGEARFGKTYFISNLGSNPSAVTTDGHIYREEAKTRVYDITVVLTKSTPGDTREYAKLNSTVTASDDI
ncbi:MAG: type II secretion system protein [Lachnospiraceae bacterium]|nr:type II secretion system protein [Lachnospiraceae bacterium]